MSLDVYLEESQPTEVYWRNITHNVGKMAAMAGLYDCCWRPDEHGITKAKQLIVPLAEGLTALLDDPARFKLANPENGWGSYEGFVDFVRAYLAACQAHPDADVRVSR